MCVLICVAPCGSWKTKSLLFFLFLLLNSQYDRARLQVQGLGFPQLYVQTLRGPDSARHHPHIHEGRKGLTCSDGETKRRWREGETFNGHRVGPRSPAGAEGCPISTARCLNLTLITSYLGPQQSEQLGKLRSVTASPRLFLL